MKVTAASFGIDFNQHNIGALVGVESTGRPGPASIVLNSSNFNTPLILGSLFQCHNFVLAYSILWNCGQSDAREHGDAPVALIPDAGELLARQSGTCPANDPKNGWGSALSFQ